jgi:DNA polymerase-3 subunit delta
MRSLRPAIRDKKFSPAYFLFGADDFLKEEALRHLLEAAVDPATRDFNLDQRRGSELDGETLASLLSMPPMMAERRVVVVRDVGALRKDARSALEKYLRSPAPDTVLILTSPADSKEDKNLEKLAEPVECDALTGAQIPKWIAARVEKQGSGGGRSISPQAIELLQDAVGSDLSQIATEIEKLLSYSRTGEIDEAAVAAVVGIRREDTPAKLLDAVSMRDSSLALSLIPGVLQQPKVTAVAMVMALTTQTLALASALARRIPKARLSSEFYNLLRTGSSNVTQRAWGEAVNAWARAVPRWKLEDLDHALEVLLRADMALKSSRVSSEEQVLSTAILSICAGATPAGPARSAA